MNRVFFGVLFSCLFISFSHVSFADSETQFGRHKEGHLPFYAVASDRDSIASEADRLSASGVPIPPVRPKTMHVSPSYIESLRARDSRDSEEARDRSLPVVSSLLPLPTDLFEEVEDLEDMQGKRLAGALFGPPFLPQVRLDKIVMKEDIVAVEGVPAEDELAMQLNYPSRMDILHAIDPSSIEPSSGHEVEIMPKKQTVISFSLKPEQIQLDEKIKFFLRDHALEMFKNNKGLSMEIQSYATGLADEEHSNVRISLARGLEIRRFLVDNGISPARLTLRSMEESDDVSEDDRVDLVLIK